jgi:hypothetical protein
VREIIGVIVGWLKNIITAILPDSIGQGAQAFERKARPRLIDVTDGVSMTEEAHRRSKELLSVIRRGGAQIDRLRFWLNARRRTRGNLADFYDMPDIMDEVTEKIVEAAKEDPFYRKMFG